jgi:hypothetical protein
LRGFRARDSSRRDRELARARRGRAERVPRAELYDRITRDGARQPVFLPAAAAAPRAPGEARRGASVEDLLPSHTILPAPRARAPSAPSAPTDAPR